MSRLLTSINFYRTIPVIKMCNFYYLNGSQCPFPNAHGRTFCTRHFLQLCIPQLRAHNIITPMQFVSQGDITYPEFIPISNNVASLVVDSLVGGVPESSNPESSNTRNSNQELHIISLNVETQTDFTNIQETQMESSTKIIHPKILKYYEAENYGYDECVICTGPSKLGIHLPCCQLKQFICFKCYMHIIIKNYNFEIFEYMLPTYLVDCPFCRNFICIKKYGKHLAEISNIIKEINSEIK